MIFLPFFLYGDDHHVSNRADGVGAKSATVFWRME